MNKRIFVTGMAGTGKTSIANELKKKGFSTFDLDSIPGLCSWVSYETGKKVPVSNTSDIDDDFLEKNDYKCDTNMLSSMIHATSGTVFVFGAVGDNSDLLPLFDQIFLLQISSKTMIKRIANRDTNDFGKDESIHDTLVNWRLKFDQLMLDAGAVSVNAEKELSEVVNMLLTRIK